MFVTTQATWKDWTDCLIGNTCSLEMYSFSGHRLFYPVDINTGLLHVVKPPPLHCNLCSSVIIQFHKRIEDALWDVPAEMEKGPFDYF
jgi:hypothetical protein